MDSPSTGAPQAGQTLSSPATSDPSAWPPQHAWPHGSYHARYLPWRQLARNAIDRHQALHNPGELTALLAVLDALRPRVILEIGTWAGGSAWAWSQLHSVDKIVTVDLDAQPQAAHRLDNLSCPVIPVKGNSRHQQTYDAVLAALGGSTVDVLVIDGGHDYDTARSDWDTYSTLVPPTGLAVLHDTQGYPGNPTVQVPQLWDEIRSSYPVTELVDHPGGPGGTGIVWL